MVFVGENQGTDQQDLEALYRDHVGALREVAEGFNLPHETAGELAHQVMLAGIRRMDKVPDARAWLIAAFTAAARAAVRETK